MRTPLEGSSGKIFREKFAAVPEMGNQSAGGPRDRDERWERAAAELQARGLHVQRDRGMRAPQTRRASRRAPLRTPAAPEATMRPINGQFVAPAAAAAAAAAATPVSPSASARWSSMPATMDAPETCAKCAICTEPLCARLPLAVLLNSARKRTCVRFF